MSDALDNLTKIAQDFKANFDIPVKPLSSMVDVNIANYKPRKEDTFAYQMQMQTDQIIEKSEEQIKLLKEQNEHLNKNIKNLEELLKIKETELEESEKETKKAKTYNTWMMIITILSMLAAMASWIIPLLIAD